VSYRLKVSIFFLTTFIGLIILPVMNLYRAGDEFKISRETLFNVDYFIPLAQKKVYPFGISLDPKQVIIGKEDWLYLGNQYKENIATRRNGLSFAEIERAKDLQLGLEQWDNYFKSEGVRVFQVMMGPDKETIYPEYLPDWAKPSKATRTDALLSGEHSNLISDIRSSLIDAKSVYDRPLYYKTDTHWNSLGAWIAFNAFIEDISADKGLIQGNWLTSDQVSISSVSPAEGGDLSNFLRLKLPDERPIMTLGKEINVTRIDFNTGEIIGDKGNPDVSPPSSPLLFKNPEALNSAKVLWLRDSFGGPITPYMSATFSEVLQIHYIYVIS
jgi:alginate O-acetyltransferase complex protein AlgJ